MTRKEKVTIFNVLGEAVNISKEDYDSSVHQLFSGSGQIDVESDLNEKPAKKRASKSKWSNK